MAEPTPKTEKTLALSEIRAEIDRVQNELGLSTNTVEISFERNSFNLRVEIPDVTDSLLVDALAIAKKHLENWRIHTFEKSFLSIQALNENLFSSEGLLDKIKIRISGIYGEKSFEVTKKGALTPAELSLTTALLRRLLGKRSAKNYLAELQEMGCHILKPESGKSELALFSKLRDKLRETVILPIKKPEVYDAIANETRKIFALNRPRAVLFAGPPGTGKTTMARHIGQEAGLVVVHVPLENILSAYYGESTKRLGMIFDAATAAREPLILFLDEIDALAPSRNEKLFEASRRLLSVLLRKIDGLETQSNIITIGATNRQQDLDSALLSRFDTILEFSEPGEDDIKELLNFYAKHLTGEETQKLAAQLVGLSVRAIRDVCLRAERNLAREKIDEGAAATPSAPTLAYYVRTLADYKLTRES